MLRLEFGLVDHSREFLVSPCNALKMLPAIKIKQVVLPGIDCTGDRIICSNDGEGLRGNFHIFPFDHDIELGTLVTWVRCLEGAFVGNNAPELPLFGSIIILLFNVVEDLSI